MHEKCNTCLRYHLERSSKCIFYMKNLQVKEAMHDYVMTSQRIECNKYSWHLNWYIKTPGSVKTRMFLCDIQIKIAPTMYRFDLPASLKDKPNGAIGFLTYDFILAYHSNIWLNTLFTKYRPLQFEWPWYFKATQRQIW